MRRLAHTLAFLGAAGLVAYLPAAQATGFYTFTPPAPRAPGAYYGNHQRGFGFNNQGRGAYSQGYRGNPYAQQHNYGWGNRGLQQPRFNGYSQGFRDRSDYQRRYNNFQQRNYNQLQRRHYGEHRRR